MFHPKAVLIKGSQNIVFEIYVNPEKKRMPKIVSCVVSYNFFILLCDLSFGISLLSKKSLFSKYV